MGDSRFEGHQHYKFEAEYDNEDGERLWGHWGGEASAGVAFQIGQIRYSTYHRYTIDMHVT